MSKKYLLTGISILTIFLTSYGQSKNLVIQMVKVEGGKFLMGSPDENKIAENDEQKQHEVTVGNFEINKLEVSVWEWKQYCKKTKKKMPAKQVWGINDNYPITNITWNEAIAYCNWLSKQDGYKPAYTVVGPNIICDFTANGYRLPTEAEWEYAAKGGKKSKNNIFSGSNISNDIAWQQNNSDKKPHAVGTKLANELGIYDMSGNVWEWCYDWYNKDYYKSEDGNNPTGPIRGEKKSVRGGSWDSKESYLRTSNRISTTPNRTYEFYGFRLARTAN
ncbi:Formylglycine-generating enzyme, required for sulfatase activity, contains SUMF1/FGE domain [Flavobacterium swingsii]|jgi:sulfatase modifying factor 1|uniref:Formylglycine-generating enzyme, required for sulfatase activity, contains SUMF1/FGE domain n=1 Tax=Flavobacterium swingsii TaxID=498292 RepID=A0A1I0V432_9FLAO|nr:formylglycine-generating enzyme family protein [Flavobacterium swingsii]SFA71068.1 Formylglycine-generating enzyme, required for sulfatase activity, contains SUMF1/FGE domain [Flavobacterium swingsii]